MCQNKSKNTTVQQCHSERCRGDDVQKYTAPVDEAADLIASCDDEEPFELPFPEKLTRTPEFVDELVDMLNIR